MRRRALVVAAVGLVLVLAGLLAAVSWVRLPGRAAQGALPALTAQQLTLARQLEETVRVLAGREHNVAHPEALEAVLHEVEARLPGAPARHSFLSGGTQVHNVVLELPGRTRALVVVGAHYDSARGTPGADDNASGVAALLALAELLGSKERERTIQLVAFVNEEPPFFRTEEQGARQYVRHLESRHEQVVAMLSLETLGYYSDAPGSQHYPAPFGLLFPDTGDFVGFVANAPSRSLALRATRAFAAASPLPFQGVCAPESLPGIGWSDHAAFWDAGIPALMVTDTAPFRNPNYHRATDTPDSLDYERLALAVVGLAAVVEELAGAPTPAGR